MMAERQIEAKVKDALAAAFAAAGLATARMRGAWDVAGEGAVKGEDGGCPVTCAVAVGVRSRESYEVPYADFACSAAVSVLAASSPDGSALCAYASAVMDALERWYADPDLLCDALRGDGDGETFLAAGLRVSGGSAPAYSEESGAWTVAVDFELRGVVERC